ncbi:SDR family NAD(P)-dependent oxidoreductase [Planctomyces sp. SH-PL62]|uniref:SDR family NAD(P)-dependent oxidoreductase n=1 Tax=Planctomyces sp. SH-PL62 TaxID=1636152 RepID=UPI00078C345F|nr:SDR family NAD(P)-dependent oxidoreductase [Planctomyces sp. SH-PL62]AMV39877.1 Serine 3-dehydrogenase [Planctomyces sp. SH-PL62]
MTTAGRVVLITGASAGLGATIAREVVRRGRARALVLVARRADRLDALAAELRRDSPALEVLTIPADLSEPDACARVAVEAVERLGGVDVLVNNAGLGLPTLFADAPAEDIARQIAVNFQAPILLTRHLVASLTSRRGTVINVGSAITCVANSALGVYGATKAGLAYWNDAIRRELARDGVTVCLVEPGPIRTEFSEAFGKLAREGASAHPVVETPSPWMTADVEDVARRVVDLLDRPRRRLSVLRRMVWPFRILGAAAWAFPALGDWFVTRVFGVDQASGRAREAR